MTTEYEVTTIGDIPARSSAGKDSLSAPVVAVVVIGGALVGTLAWWALRKWA